jgi:drug/metabolite transporter (DMT)-like permease
MSVKPKPANAANVTGLTLAAFVLVVLIGGSNAVAVRYSNQELPPFWGAGARFALAALAFWAIVFIRRIPVPTGRAFWGAAIYGMLGIGLGYAFIYWALLSLSASLTVVVLSLGPLLTFFFALAHRQERFHWRGMLGALISFAGIVIIVGDQIGSSIALAPVLGLLAGAAAIAESSVLYKSFPKGDPFAVNAVALLAGAILLLAISFSTGEAQVLPTAGSTWAAFIYLVLIGSVLLFYLFLFLLNQWTASATSYAFLLFPIATIFIAVWLLGETVTPRFILGSFVVLGGVYFGALASRR